MAKYSEIHLKSNDIDEQIRKSLDKFEKIKKWYCSGMLMETELFGHVCEAILETFEECFKKNRFVFVMDKKQSWTRFKEDYALYKQEKPCSSTNGSVWLSYQHNIEASPEDKSQWFRIIDAIHLPIDYFEPVDAYIDTDIPRPDKTDVHYYHDYTVKSILFDCVNDGGLMEDDDPIGKTYVLKSSKGLSACITVKEFEKILSEIRGFVCEGWIEGYTAKLPRKQPKICVYWNKEKHIDHINFYSSWEDQKVYNDFPLWQDYFAKVDEKEDRKKECITGCIDFWRLNVLPD